MKRIFLFLSIVLVAGLSALYLRFSGDELDSYINLKIKEQLEKESAKLSFKFRTFSTSQIWPVLEISIHDLDFKNAQCSAKIPKLSIRSTNLWLKDILRQKYYFSSIKVDRANIECIQKETKSDQKLDLRPLNPALVMASDYLSKLEINLESLKFGDILKVKDAVLEFQTGRKRSELLFRTNSNIDLADLSIPKINSSLELTIINKQKLFTKLKLAGPVKRLDWEGMIHTHSNEINGGNLNGQITKLSYIPALKDLSFGEIDFDIDLTDQISSPKLTGILRTENLSYKEHSLDEIKLVFSLSENELNIKESFVRLLGLNFKVNADLRENTLKSDILLVADNLDDIKEIPEKLRSEISIIQNRLKLNAEIPFVFQKFSPEIPKWPENSKITYQLSSRLLSKHLSSELPVTLEGSLELGGDEKNRVIDKIESQLSFDKNILEVKAKYGLDSKDTSLAFKGKIPELKKLLTRVKNTEELSERIKASAQFQGKLTGIDKALELKAQTAISGLEVDKTKLGEISSEVESKDLNKFKILNIKLNNKFSDLQAEGKYDLSQDHADLVLRVIRLELEKLPGMNKELMSGFGEGEFRIIKKQKDLIAKGKIDLDGVKISKFKSDSGYAELLFKDNIIKQGRISLIQKEKMLSPKLDLFFRSSKDRKKIQGSLAANNLKLKNVKGFARGDIVFSLPIEDPKSLTTQGRLVLSDKRGKEVNSEFDTIIKLKPKPGFVELDFSVRKGLGVKGAASLDIKNQGSFSGEFNIDQKNYALADMKIDASGKFNFSGQLEPKLDYDAFGKIDSMKVITNYANVTLSQPLEVRVEENIARLSSFTLSAGSQQKCEVAKNNGIIRLGKDVSIDFSCDIRLKTLPRPADVIRFWNGKANIDGNITGKIADPEVYLSSKVESLELKLEGLPDMIDSGNVFLNMKTRKNTGNINFSRFDISYGQGKIIGQGSIGWAKDKPTSIDINSEIKSVNWRLPEEFPLRATGELEIKGTDEKLWIRGRADIEEARYIKNMSLAQEFANIFRRPESNTVNDLVAKDQINIDLLLNFPNSISVQNNMAEAVLGGRIRVLGIPSQIGALGNLTATKGTVYFNDSEYEINSFVLNFTDDKNIYPYFQLSLSTEITDFGSDFEEEAVYPVNISMKGYPGKYDIEYSSSDSNLSQEDIISLVTFGFKQQQINDQVQNQNSGALLAGGFKLLSKMAGISTGGGEEGLPRTNIQIGSEYDKNGRFLPQLTFKMEMWKGMNLALESSSNQEQKVRLDYKVSDVVRLSGQWESDNSEDTTQLQNKSGLGLDLKLKWDF